MASSRGSVRIGPISVFSLVIILCLAVLSVLSVTTAQASYALTTRQATFSTDQYQNEAAGQRFVGLLDQELVSIRQGTASAAEVRAHLETRVNEIAQDAASRESNASITANALVNGSTVLATFSTAIGHELSIKIDIPDSGAYQIQEWKQTTKWNEAGETVRLWSGASK